MSKLIQFSNDFPKIDTDKLLEQLRELRDSTTTKEAQDINVCEIEPCLSLLTTMVDYLSKGVDNVIDKFVLLVCARVGVQFLGNSIVDHPSNRELLWTHFNSLKKMFSYDCTKMRNYVAMIYYNILLSNVDAKRDMLSDDELMFMLLDEALLGLTEYPQFIIEKLLETNSYDKLYNGEGRRLLHRIYILDLFASLLSKAKTDFDVDPKIVEAIMEDFKGKAESILNGSKTPIKLNVDPTGNTDSKCENTGLDRENGNTDTNPLKNESISKLNKDSESVCSDNVNVLSEIVKDLNVNSTSSVAPIGKNMMPRQIEDDSKLAVKLLNVLCSLSGDEKYNKGLSDNTSLVVDTIYVLRAIKMVEESSDTAQLTANPAATGFKGGLIRLLGNLCWKNRKNQDLVRENHCIPLILDCCKMDEHNPFICEWSIMAIKNLCEDNQENQSYIDSIKQIETTKVVQC